MNFFGSPSLEFFTPPGEGIATQSITSNNAGRVDVNAVSWPAKLHLNDRVLNISKGQKVVIIGRQGNTLLVVPFR
ncbi:NfeD family protein [Nodosilinea sp. LEGE 07088]|uniref:NfeD family protein n=1 Tax=Nodosilinea sp. LEGE 07088 TaxID=2777968 RepID=UPI00187EE351|nr:NfeD family protein [Nodosilinea sp. LEGE 07088]